MLFYDKFVVITENHVTSRLWNHSTGVGRGIRIEAFLVIVQNIRYNCRKEHWCKLNETFCRKEGEMLQLDVGRKAQLTCVLCILQRAEDPPHQHSPAEYSKRAVDHDPLPHARNHQTLLWLPREGRHRPEPGLLPQTGHPPAQGELGLTPMCL